MPRRPASVPDLCIFWRSSDPNEGVSFVLFSSRASCVAIRVDSVILPLVLIRTSAVMECAANSSFPSRHHPLCRLHLPSSLATICDSLKGGWVLLLAPCAWVRRIQLSVVERVGISSAFSLSLRPGQFMTVGCGVAVSSPQILSFPLPEFLKKGGMVRAVSPWYFVAWKTPFNVRNNFQEKDFGFLSLSNFNCRVSSFCRLAPSVFGLAFVKVCLRRCHCAPSMLRGPDGS